ncbi:MAG TPA: hypothetical protein VN238_16495 [Solirubrobacteraceae bacterium]|nr:hypothetical protein [Solirubrobacteraceae bacterium]
MVHTEIAGNDARIARQPGPGEAVVVTRYGKPQFVVLRWEDFAPLETLIDEFLAAPPYELGASDTAVRAAALDREPEGDDFDFDGLADALGR